MAIWRTCWRERESSNARYHFETALRFKPKDAAVRYNFAVALGRARDFDEAQQQLQAALESDPTLADAHELIANLLMARNQAAAALPHYRAWVRLQPESAQAQFGLGSALAMTGDRAAAIPICGGPMPAGTLPHERQRHGCCANLGLFRNRKHRLAGPAERRPHRRNLWVTGTLQWAPDARLARPANPMADNAASAFQFAASCLEPEFALSGKRYAVREDLRVPLSGHISIVDVIAGCWPASRTKRAILILRCPAMVAAATCPSARQPETGAQTPL